MNKLKIIIIDDEPLAHQVLEGYCAKIDYVAVVGKYFDAISALNHLKNEPVDALLLDIQMPDLTGMELLDMLHDDGPKVILTTAYTDYALQGFSYDNVVDYLHKPIKFSRFLKGVERLKKLLLLEQEFLAREITAAIDPVPTARFITINDNKTIYKIAFDDIIYVQSWGNYLKIFMDQDEMHLVRKTISDLELEVPSNQFERIHKSFLVNINKVKSIESNQVRIGEMLLPIGKSYLVSTKKRMTG